MIRRYLTPWPTLPATKPATADLRQLIEAAEARHSRRTGGGES